MGQLIIILAFAATLFSAWNYYLSSKLEGDHKGKKKSNASLKERKLRRARQGFCFMAAFVILASGYLLYLIFTHQFQYSYVYRYTSRELPFGLLLSTFWAGQEGSFLLWAFYIAVMGLIFMRVARQFETHAMLFLNLIQAFFLILLFKASPFALQAETPANGMGLNPLLQNFWMVIHPPVLFLGYAACAFPLVLALTALVRKKFDTWISLATPWALFTSVTLGAGIILGAFWAYGTLGWGGYWGWDPVENSSLIPWLVNIGLVHGLIVEKVKGALKKTNLFLAIISFVLVLYSTFLTRSGVLADFSVHSFSELGINAYLLTFLFSTLGFGLGMLARRFREISGEMLDISRLNKENALVVSMFVFLGSAIVTLLGTSFPIISGFFGQASNVKLSYYNQVNLPFGIAIAALLGITPLLKWGKNANGTTKQILISLGLTGLSIVLALLARVREPMQLLFIASLAFAFWSNGMVLLQQARNHWQNTAAPMAHIGVALMLLGVIVSGNFSHEQLVVLSKGEAKMAFGRQLTFEGIEKVGGKDRLNIRVSGDGSEYLATPKLYFVESNRSTMREPFIETGWLQDLYFSPVDEMAGQQNTELVQVILKKGETRKVGDYAVKFAAFDMSSHETDGAVRIGANLDVVNGKENFSVTPVLVIGGNGRQALPAPFPGYGNGHAGPTVYLHGINADDKSVQLVFDGMTDLPKDGAVTKERVSVQVSTRPFMNVLWLGTILLTAGTVVAFTRRLAPPEPKT